MRVRYILLWVPMTFIGVVNGIIRQYGYNTYVDELSAHQISSVTGILFFGIYIWFIEKKWPLATGTEALQIGFTWFLITILFEFVFGHYVMNHSWTHLLADYNIFAGRVWGIVLVAILFLPYIVFRLQYYSKFETNY